MLAVDLTLVTNTVRAICSYRMIPGPIRGLLYSERGPFILMPCAVRSSLLEGNVTDPREPLFSNVIGQCFFFSAGERNTRWAVPRVKAYFYGLMTHKYRGSQQSSREVKPKFIDSTQGEPKNIYKL